MSSHHDPQPTPEQRAQERWLRSRMEEIEHEVHAPRRLRRHIEATSRASRRRARWTPRRPSLAILPGAMAGALATALAAAVLLPSGPAAPSLAQAAEFSQRGAAAPPPTPDPDDPGVKLSEDVGDVYFPDWSSTLGWRPTGMRRDLAGFHRAVTVYYADGAGRLAYTILSAPALPQPAATVSVTVTVQNGIAVRTLRLHGRLVVTWRREGSTCILTGTHVSVAQLRRLALTDPPPDD
jgi:hypothetical protein